jgi:hypothetical protein
MATPPILTFGASGQTQTSTVPVVNAAFNPPLKPGQKVTIVLVVQDQLGNKSQPLAKTLTVQAPPTAGFTTTPTDSVIPGQPIKLDATSSGPAGVTLTFNWTANLG